MLENETLLTLSEAAKIAPGRPHSGSVWRCCRRGVKARDGTRVFLEHLRFAGKIYTSAEALSRFSEALTAADVAYFNQAPGDSTTPPPRKRTATQRSRAVERAHKELEAAGI